MKILPSLLVFTSLQSLLLKPLYLKALFEMNMFNAHMLEIFMLSYMMRFRDAGSGNFIVAKNHPLSEARNLDGWAVRVVCHPP
jgi:hypothetical protein